ncbi:hypothetical protein Afil01_24620 [Actinorhabdospora filicis]|uniref:Uncharacterized protein n=1 Tax=Actinorhabdospora filicis TaxID=1785913 RepID=A0A9W6SKM9_9ACTN|nr:hypothetical protein [Actinorhabdospora filicis]GLZ77655.1 hypothetical protein Afil01_24620 [Actinorhabdospora filicis]
MTIIDSATTSAAAATDLRALAAVAGGYGPVLDADPIAGADRARAIADYIARLAPIWARLGVDAAGLAATAEAFAADPRERHRDLARLLREAVPAGETEARTGWELAWLETHGTPARGARAAFARDRFRSLAAHALHGRHGERASMRMPGFAATWLAAVLTPALIPFLGLKVTAGAAALVLAVAGCARWHRRNRWSATAFVAVIAGATAAVALTMTARHLAESARLATWQELLVLAPVLAAAPGVRPFAVRLSALSPRVPILAGITLTGAALALLTTVGADAHLGVLPAVFLLAIGLPLLWTASPAAYFGASAGLLIAVTVAAAHTGDRLAEGASRRDAFAGGLATGCAAGLVLLAIGTAITLLAVRDER